MSRRAATVGVLFLVALSALSISITNAFHVHTHEHGRGSLGDQLEVVTDADAYTATGATITIAGQACLNAWNKAMEIRGELMVGVKVLEALHKLSILYPTIAAVQGAWTEVTGATYPAAPNLARALTAQGASLPAARAAPDADLYAAAVAHLNLAHPEVAAQLRMLFRTFSTASYAVHTAHNNLGMDALGQSAILYIGPVTPGSGAEAFTLDGRRRRLASATSWLRTVNQRVMAAQVEATQALQHGANAAAAALLAGLAGPAPAVLAAMQAALTAAIAETHVQTGLRVPLTVVGGLDMGRTPHPVQSVINPLDVTYDLWTYRLDVHGRVIRAQGPLSNAPNAPPLARVAPMGGGLTSSPTGRAYIYALAQLPIPAGNDPDREQCGHIRAKSLGGRRGLINFVPQAKTANVGTATAPGQSLWFEEPTWGMVARYGCSVRITITFAYAPFEEALDHRPTRFTWTSDQVACPPAPPELQNAAWDNENVD